MLLSAIYLWTVGAPQAPVPQDQPTNTQEEAPDVVENTPEALVERVSQLILVDANETPEIFTVEDPEAFRANQGITVSISQGDKVLQWKDQWVVYSPTADKIITILAPIPPTPPAPEPEATVEIRNGSGAAGAASRMQQTVRGAGLTVARIGDAAVRRPSGGTVIIDLSGGTVPNTIAKLLEILPDAEVSTLPSGEPAGEASVLIVIGQE
jgi:hypothetical protein